MTRNESRVIIKIILAVARIETISEKDEHLWRIRRTREPGNQGTREPGNQGTREPGNQGTREPGNQGTRYDNIQLMRGIAAVTVIFQHILMFSNGAFGVDLFFCISGFIMMHTTEKDSTHFLQKRAVRIIPLYWIAIFATTALLLIMPQYFRKQYFSIANTIMSMFFIPCEIVGANGTANSVVEVGWTLICEVFFYVIFFISLKINHRWRHVITSAVLLLIVITNAVLSETIDSYFLNFYGNTVMLEFAFGMFSYKVLSKKTDEKRTSHIFLIFAVLIWIFLFSIKYATWTVGIPRILHYGIPSFMFFVLIYKYFRIRKVPRFFIFLGNISYSIYLTHTFIVQPFSRLVYNIDQYSHLGLILVFVFVVPVCIGVAYISWYVIENKFTSYVRIKTGI